MRNAPGSKRRRVVVTATDECSYCLDMLNARPTVQLRSCGHAFHEDCHSQLLAGTSQGCPLRCKRSRLADFSRGAEFTAVSTSTASPAADLPVPEGFTAVGECPDIESLLSKSILFKWSCGWCVGTVAKRNCRKGSKYNYLVSYQEADGSTSEYRQLLDAASYWCPQGGGSSGHWCVLQVSALGGLMMN